MSYFHPLHWPHRYFSVNTVFTRARNPRVKQTHIKVKLNIGEVPFFTGRGALKNWGARYFFLDQKGSLDQKNFVT